MPDSATPLDRDRLVKLLNLTASPHDGEALAAVRRSNEMLQQAGRSWSDLFGAPSATVSAEKEGAADSPDEPQPEWPDTSESAAATEGVMQSREAGTRAARQRIRSVPIAVRWALFPLWWSAEAYAVACIGERGLMRLVTLAAPLLVFLLSGGLWGYLVRGILGTLLP